MKEIIIIVGPSAEKIATLITAFRLERTAIKFGKDGKEQHEMLCTLSTAFYRNMEVIVIHSDDDLPKWAMDDIKKKAMDGSYQYSELAVKEGVQ